MQNETVQHEGFVADVYEEDGKRHLHVTNCGDSLHTSFECHGSAQEALRDLIDDYRATCVRVGKEPALRVVS